MISHLKPACVMLAIFTVLTGMVYPAAVTGLAQALFPGQANGSLIRDRDGRLQGSRLIGQPYSDPGLFWGRPSATAAYPYNAGASGGSNQGPLNPALKDAVQARIQALREADPGNTAPVPVDLVTASASGLDPQISPAAAEYQVGRVARARHLAPQTVRDLVARHTEDRQWGVLGEPRVNVLELNLELAALPR
ncbi:potassium-transporting ATPase subunit KdpC [Methylomagnum ishizawai]|uniref:potassium-transporting ATPase subunit KdpC n=1 Tax=Methylomagnum ishizawai TaxID=1760988 RepID=UPI001C332BAD|nr:potassium-transporting ATPase subunit KdpC [Methylomagnum ishizawai]BBL76401.1 potassium-transporting ATPase KdpC subunit [Methylomagnum ishizawai]